MILTGKIDRIDICREGDVLYLKIVDYKTGTEKFDAVKVLNGLQLQLPLYLQETLEAEKAAGRHVIPAGMLYHEIKDPVIDGKKVEGEKSPDEVRLGELKENGMISYDEAVLGHMDHAFREGKTESKVLPLKLDKKGGRYRSDVTYTEDHFRTLGSYALACAKGIGEAIMSGQVEVRPYLYGSESGCTYCAYRDVCGFDPSLPDAPVRRIGKIGEKAAFLEMEEALKKTGDTK